MVGRLAFGECRMPIQNQGKKWARSFSIDICSTANKTHEKSWCRPNNSSKNSTADSIALTYSSYYHQQEVSNDGVRCATRFGRIKLLDSKANAFFPAARRGRCCLAARATIDRRYVVQIRINELD